MSSADDQKQARLEAEGFVVVWRHEIREALLAAKADLRFTDALGPRWVYSRALDNQGRVVWAKQELIELTATLLSYLTGNSVRAASALAAVLQRPELEQTLESIWRLGGVAALNVFLAEHAPGWPNLSGAASSEPRRRRR